MNPFLESYLERNISTMESQLPMKFGFLKNCTIIPPPVTGAGEGEVNNSRLGRWQMTII